MSGWSVGTRGPAYAAVPCGRTAPLVRAASTARRSGRGPSQRPVGPGQEGTADAGGARGGEGTLQGTATEDGRRHALVQTRRRHSAGAQPRRRPRASGDDGASAWVPRCRERAALARGADKSEGRAWRQACVENICFPHSALL